MEYSRQARRHADEAKDVRWRYPVAKLCETYNGNGAKGSGGPKTEWLRAACDLWIGAHHPHLQLTFIERLFIELGWQVIFTPPYWADSQPIELVWSYIKNWLGLQWYCGRSMKDLRRQMLMGMYGGAGIYDNRFHGPVDSALGTKLIEHAFECVRVFIRVDPVLSGEGLLGC